MNFKKIMLIGFFANVAEWYDFSIYAFLAASIGQLFFNSSSPKLALIKTFFIFTASYLIRPIGSFFWGYFGDCYGRKVVLKWSLMLMAVPTIVIGLLPAYSTYSLACLIILRLIQGFAAGGELPITACYIYEISPQDKKNFFCSIVAVSPIIGVLSGSITAFLIYHFFTSQEVLQYAWRIPFLFGIVILFLVLYIRRNIEETEEFKQLLNKSNAKLTLKTWFYEQHIKDLKPLLNTFALYVFIQSAFYLMFVWMPSYLHTFLLISKDISFFANTIGMVLLVLFTLVIGYFAKEYKKLALLSILSIAIMCIPLFLLLQTRKIEFILISYVIFALCLSCIDGIIINVLVRTFKPINRCSGVSIGFTLPTAVFGGVLPTLCSYFIYKTNNNLFPAFLLFVICVITLPIIYKSKSF